ncbi:FecR family protein [Daejeonella sp.]|uniref:FecR family protein n=1 Tax=Daejeonella sp. TaxID=2805397 RepID=UPI00272F7453|nr:FecR family protein [Daejeonella sp.]MDP2413501.1 FecR family protein [Daejeonella sp.]
MKEIDKVLITKYVTRQANEEEIAMAKYLISSSKVHEEFYLQLYETWQRSIYYKIGFIDSEQAYSDFLDKSTVRKMGTIFRLKYLTIAASFLIICGVAFYFYKAYRPDKVHTITEINVPKGAMRKIVLPDGTKVTINAGSTLKFESDFGKGTRTVHLNGEAYFDISKSKIPFIVNANNYTIRDIGTIFNVKAYPDDLSFETMVIEGEVQVEGKLSIDSDKSQMISVKQQQVLKLNYSSSLNHVIQPDKDFSEIIEVKVQKISPAQVEVYTGWTEDLLVFEGITFQEITRIMERRYDVEIIVDNSEVKNLKYTGSFKNIDDIDKALKIMKETTDIAYEKQGRIIKIRKGINFKSQSL